jgi:hypothetical protein
VNYSNLVKIVDWEPPLTEDIVYSETCSYANIRESWTSAVFPRPGDSGLSPYWYKLTTDMHAIKRMLTSMDLRNGRDYVFTTGSNTVLFRDSGDALIATFKWLASDYYNGRSS